MVLNLVKVKLHTILKKYCPNDDGSLQVQCGEDLTVGEMLESLSLNRGLVWLVLVNGKVAHNDCRLAEEDEVELYPVFGGG